MEAYVGRRGITPLARSVVTRWRSLVNIISWPLYSRKRTAVPVWMFGCPCRDSNPGPSSPYPSHCTDCDSGFTNNNLDQFILHEKAEADTGSVSVLSLVLAVRALLSVSHTNMIIKHVTKFYTGPINFNLGFPLPWASNLLSPRVWCHTALWIRTDISE